MTFSIHEVESAHTLISSHLSPTPLERVEFLEKKLNYDGRIYLKWESDQPTGSFKVRGAFNALLNLTLEQRQKGVVTRSSGNFAQAVGYASQKLGINATIVMPENAPQIKIEGTKKFGPKILFSPPKHEEGEKIVDGLVETEGFIKLHPYNDYHTIAGQGTCALEFLEQYEKLEEAFEEEGVLSHFYAPIGGGGLMSGCATAIKQTDDVTTVHGVEPEGAADFQESVEKGYLQKWETINTIADGLRASSVGQKNYPILKNYVDYTTTVSDSEIIEAMRLIFDATGRKIEPSGVVSLAGFIKDSKEIFGNVIILISGQNVDPDKFDEWARNS
jgi:threonine dehydratase